jgi:hypothetical protein
MGMPASRFEWALLSALVRTEVKDAAQSGTPRPTLR